MWVRAEHTEEQVSCGGSRCSAEYGSQMLLHGHPGSYLQPRLPGVDPSGGSKVIGVSLFVMTAVGGTEVSGAVARHESMGFRPVCGD